MIIPIPALDVALAAMNELNSFARSPEGVRPRKAIYWLKSRYAIRDAAMAGMLTRARLIQVTTKCHKCHKGVYMDWGGYPRGQCYTCRGTSVVNLKFVETQIGARYTWHHPLAYSSWQGWPMDDLTPDESHDWTVKQEGKTLSLVEMVTALNIVEAKWQAWRKHSPYENSRDEYDSSRFYTFDYGLDLGYTPEGCVLCGGVHKSFTTLDVVPRLQRNVSICEPCLNLGWDELTPRLKALPLPELHPEIQIWRERHAINFEDTWKRQGWHCPSNETSRLPGNQSKIESGLFKIPEPTR